MSMESLECDTSRESPSSMRARSLRRRCALGAACGLAASLVALAANAPGEPPVEKRVDSMRCEGQYEAAAALAESLSAAKAAAGESLEASDARRLAETMHTAGAAPEALRRRLAKTDCESSRIDTLFGRAEYAEAARLTQSQLDTRIEVFGMQHDEVAASLGDFGVIRRREGHFAEAESLYAQAFSIRRNVLGENHPRMAMLLNNLASLHKDLGRYPEAVDELRRALAIRRRHLSPDDPALASTLHSLGTTLIELAEYAEADTLLRESLAIKGRTVGEADASYARTLLSLGDVQDNLGDRGGAEVLYRRALATAHAALGDDHLDVAHARQQLGMHLKEQGDCEEARKLVEEALDVKRRILGEEHQDVATVLENLAGILDRCRDYAAAESLRREAYARQVAHLGPEHPSSVMSLAELARLKIHMRAYAEAESLSSEALGIARSIYPPGDLEIARLEYKLAVSRDWLGDYDGAAPLFEDAIAICRRALGNTHPDVEIALRGQGHLYLASGDLERAAASLTEAAEIFESARARAGSGMARATFLEPPHALLAATQLLRGRPDDAWPAVERDRGRVLADLLMDADRRSLNAAEREAERALNSELMDREREFDALRKSASDSLREEARGRLLEAETRWTMFQRDIAAHYPVGEGQVYSLERVQAALPPRTAIIGWLDVDFVEDSCLAWGYVVRGEGPVSWFRVEDVGSEAKDPPEWLGRFVKDLRDPNSNGASVEGARRLWKARFAPLEPALNGIDDLIVIPTGPTAGIPLECLIDASGASLGERFAISYIPSCTVFAWLTERSHERMAWKRALLMGDPPFSDADLVEMEHEAAGGGAAPPPIRQKSFRAAAEDRGALSDLPRLPGTRKEVAAIDSVLDEATSLLGGAASEQAIVQRVESGKLAEYDVLHFATHAIVDHRQPEHSALVLSLAKLPDPEKEAIRGERIIDGLITAEEVLREWHINADLVTLSACESGLGKEVGGEGTVGFAHAFFQAGARSVLVSLWRVDDRATSLLMQRFYENVTGAYSDKRAGRVGAPMSKAEALREAKSWLRGYRSKSGRTQYAHPSYWSPFVLIGSR
jgi:CHAT domain-containing protein/tetratricopeptide (TPR) repeat protein